MRQQMACMVHIYTQENHSLFLLDIVAYLITSGADVHFRTPDNENLLFACTTNHNTNFYFLIQYLAINSGDLNSVRMLPLSRDAVGMLIILQDCFFNVAYL